MRFWRIFDSLFHCIPRNPDQWETEAFELVLSGKAIALRQFEKTQLEKVLTGLAQDPFEQVTQTA
jgi:hypothetical protein